MSPVRYPFSINPNGELVVLFKFHDDAEYKEKFVEFSPLIIVLNNNSRFRIHLRIFNNNKIF